MRGTTPEATGGKPYLLAKTSFSDPRGSVIAELSLIFETLDRLSFTQHFLPGEYTIRVETDRGYQGEAAFEVGRSSADTIEVWVKK